MVKCIVCGRWNNGILGMHFFLEMQHTRCLRLEARAAQVQYSTICYYVGILSWKDASHNTLRLCIGRRHLSIHLDSCIEGMRLAKHLVVLEVCISQYTLDTYLNTLCCCEYLSLNTFQLLYWRDASLNTFRLLY